jgi:hypothetical protein
MSNIKVLSDDNCACGAGVGQIPIAPSVNPSESIVVRAAPGTVTGNNFIQYTEGGKTIYELIDLEIALPGVAFSNNAGTREVGETVAEVIFSGSITETTYPIVSRSISPVPEALDLTAPFTFIKEDVKRTTPGQAETHTLSATDNQGGVRNVASSVSFKHAVYQGFNGITPLTEADIKALANKHIVDSIATQYGGDKSYVVPSGGPKYIYWVGSVGTPVPSGAVLNGLTLPLTALSPVDVENIHDDQIVVAYWVLRTANRLDPGTYQITLI